MRYLVKWERRDPDRNLQGLVGESSPPDDYNGSLILDADNREEAIAMCEDEVMEQQWNYGEMSYNVGEVT